MQQQLHSRSISLKPKVAVPILMRMKEKQAADVLSNIPPDQSAKLIAEIAKKK
ncbi:MAG: hypothetical protein Ct9H90mP8_0710 [Pseudomonadota bacterium]|nr:MAG: hypothetical protein Ct9H90mP8_0710 [Pseudomonadota bacterium]